MAEYPKSALGGGWKSGARSQVMRKVNGQKMARKVRQVDAAIVAAAAAPAPDLSGASPDVRLGMMMAPPRRG